MIYDLLDQSCLDMFSPLLLIPITYFISFAHAETNRMFSETWEFLNCEDHPKITGPGGYEVQKEQNTATQHEHVSMCQKT